MARALSAEKRRLILQSALEALAEKGLAASTSAIAKGAGLAEGTMFTYFASKEALLNALYVELKTEAFRRVQSNFPEEAPLRERVQHIWMEYLQWATERPAERKVAMLLHLSPVVSEANRKRMSAELGLIAETMTELGTQGAFASLPTNFAAAAMKSIEEAVIETALHTPEKNEDLFRHAFEAFWRMAE